MIVVIAGGRDIVVPSKAIQKSLEAIGFDPSKDSIISGGASGVDTCAETYCTENSIPFKVYKADWDFYGKSAGPIRNSLMAKDADHLILFWDGKSKGSKNMKSEMESLGKPVFEVLVRRKA